MGLIKIIEFIRSLEKELALINHDPSDPIQDQLKAHFATQNVRIRSYRTASGRPTDIAVLSSDDEVLEITTVDTLRELVESFQSNRPGSGIPDGEYKSFLAHLKETTFTSYDKEQMLYASREIEDRARRVGQGTVHAGFQRCSVMTTQQDIYADLAQRGINLHLYGVADTLLPEIGNATIHTDDTDEIAHTWFVIFDGGGEATQKSALLAEERDTDQFYGVWTYDSQLVDKALIYLDQQYVSADDHQSASHS